MREGKKWIKAIPLKNRQELAEAIKCAFYEGHDSYMTPACAYTSVDDEWDGSGAKVSYDRLLEEQGE